MWLYLLIGLLLIYALYKERQALGCPTVPNGEDCRNAQGKAVSGTTPSERDSTSDLYQKLKLAASFADRWVMWRMAFLMSAVGLALCFFFWYRRLPTEFELALGLFVLTAVFYFTMNFYKFHLMSHVRKNIDQTVELLKGRSMT